MCLRIQSVYYMCIRDKSFKLHRQPQLHIPNRTSPATDGVRLKRLAARRKCGSLGHNVKETGYHRNQAPGSLWQVYGRIALRLDPC